MRKHRVAAWVMAAALVTGVGAALAESSPPGPTVEPTTTTSAVVDDSTTTTTVEPTTTSTTVAGSTTTTEATAAPTGGDGEADHPDNHGARVSEAAHDHSHDAECGNHGHYVSAVAHGESTCTPGSEPGKDQGDHAQDGGESDSSGSHS